MFPGLIARPLRALLVLCVLAGIVGAVWLWNRAGASTAADQDRAVEVFRATPGGGSVRAGVPRPGVYRFRQSGSERGGVGPLKLSRDLPRAALYVVTATPGGYREELDISEEHVESAELRRRPKGTLEVARRTKVTFLGVGRDDRRALRPAPLRFPRALPVGAAWSARYVAGALPVSVRGRVLRSETLELEGARVPVRVIRRTTDTGGTHPGRRVDTYWWSPTHAMPLRWTIDLEIGGPATLRTRAGLTLESLTPRV